MPSSLYKTRATAAAARATPPKAPLTWEAPPVKGTTEVVFTGPGAVVGLATPEAAEVAIEDVYAAGEEAALEEDAE